MLDLIKTIFEKFSNYETNITDFEKMVNKYRIDRKKLLLIAFYILLLVGINSAVAFFLTHQYANLQSYVFITSMLVLFILIFFLGKKYAKIMGMIIAYTYLPIYLSIINIKLYYEGFSIVNIVFSILLFSFILLMYSSAYLFVRDTLTMGEAVGLTFILSEGDESINAKLISVTKNGDYIIQPADKDNQEVFLNRDFVKKVIYNKPKN
ncbi:hypothetical protein J7E42_04020 [Bacillus sp. ISL-37]|nr:hypothetical protein [Bacillus sp. ISL-37]